MGALEEIEAIKRLKARYFRLMDTKQWDQWGDVFTEDAHLAASPDPNETFHGRADIVKRVSAVLRDARTVHHGHMPEIDLTSPTTAVGIWAMEDMLRWPDGGPMRTLHGYGQAWALTHFLIDKHFDKFLTFYRRLGELPPDTFLSAEIINQIFDESIGIDRGSLEQQWKAYMATLKTDIELILEADK